MVRTIRGAELSTVIKKLPVRVVRVPSSQARPPRIDPFRRGQRTELMVTPGSLSFGGRSIPLDSVTKAQWFTPRDLPIPLCAILRIEALDEVFDLSVEPMRLSRKDLPFETELAQFSILGKRAKVLIAVGMVGFVLLRILWGR